MKKLFSKRLIVLLAILLLALASMGAGWYVGHTSTFDNVNVNGNLVIGQKWGASVGGGSIAFGISESSIRPQYPPTNGGVMWVEPGGKLFWMDEAGTITQLAP